MKSIALMCVLLVGCGAVRTTTPPLAPGAVNRFDQDSYTSLIAAQAAINSLRTSVGQDPNLALLKAPLNQAIQDYNVADAAWQAYHIAATAANQAAVTTSLARVQVDVQGIQKAVK